MELVARQRDSRRDGLPIEFPLTDSQGLLVTEDRRRLPDRRKVELGYGSNALRLALSKKDGRIRSRLIFISLIVATNAAFILLAYALIVAIKS